MNLHEAERHRRVAAALADTLEPLIQAQLEAEFPPAVISRRVFRKADQDAMDAAQRVADALTALDQTKFSGGREVAARQALERAARTLRTRMTKREARHGGR